jgi:ABC-type transport system involved in cytochrome c biogenesis permease subunit
MAVRNKSLARRVGRVTIPGLLFLASLVLVILTLVVEEMGKGPDLRVVKNWVLIAAAIVGAYAVLSSLGRGGLTASPGRTGTMLALMIVLFYVSMQELRVPRFHFLSLPASVVQMLVLLLIAGPMVVRAFRINMPDVAPKDIVTRLR